MQEPIRVCCPSGHVVGIIDGHAFTMKHQRRELEIPILGNTPIEISIKCDRCGKKFTFLLKKSQNEG